MLKKRFYFTNFCAKYSKPILDEALLTKCETPFTFVPIPETMQVSLSQSPDNILVLQRSGSQRIT